MTILDIINKKRLNKALNYDELYYAFMGYYSDEIPDYQMSSLLMAICLNGMNDEEILDLTDIFIKSGEVLDLTGINGVTVDKHSTGGVGDKTTLIISSIVAALGVKVPKMSGRGLGHTGGTIDKLESIPGFRVNLSKEEFINQLNSVGFAIISQTSNLAPLDKKIYALRDVTDTVESIPLIASSIMSKKIASGAEKIVLDVKVGQGALLKTQQDALEACRIMKMIGKKYNRDVETMITYMDIPLGTSIGNSLEILEVIRILSNQEDNYLVALSKALASKMAQLGLGISSVEADRKVDECLKSGKALQKLIEMVKAQGGDISGIKVSKNTQEIYSDRKGIIENISAYNFGKLSLDLGGGRVTKDDVIDPKVGIVLRKKIGDVVETGDLLCTLYLKENASPIDFDIDHYFSFTNIKETTSNIMEERKENVIVTDSNQVLDDNLSEENI